MTGLRSELNQLMHVAEKQENSSQVCLSQDFLYEKTVVRAEMLKLGFSFQNLLPL